MNTRRYRLIVEQYDDGQLTRRMEESRDKLGNDHSDGERTVGLLLSFVPQWSAADAVGGSGLATMAYMANYLPRTDGDIGIFKQIGEAYEKWGASHNFDEGVFVVVSPGVNECNACECDHERKRDEMAKAKLIPVPCDDARKAAFTAAAEKAGMSLAAWIIESCEMRLSKRTAAKLSPRKQRGRPKKGEA